MEISLRFYGRLSVSTADSSFQPEADELALQVEICERILRTLVALLWSQESIPDAVNLINIDYLDDRETKAKAQNTRQRTESVYTEWQEILIHLKVNF